MSHNPRLTSTTTDEGTTAYSYLFADKVGSITKGSESFSFTYDGTLLTGITQSGMLNQTINYTYNNDFLPSSMTYAGVTENYGYDNDGLLTASGAYTLTRDAANGFVTTITDGTLTQHRSYNGYGEITQVSNDIFTYELSQRDKSGAITQKRETLNGTTETFDYSYDEMGRLTEVKRNNTLVESYTYDPNGNRASATINGVTTTASYTLDDQLVVYGDNAYRYDNDGYLTEKTTPDGTTAYSYGTMGELFSATTPTKTITYKHNANSQRVSKSIDGTVTEKYLWANLTTLLAIYDSSDNLVQRFEYADSRMPVAMTMGATKYYLHYDQVGSLRAITDDSHNIVKEITYDTFGNILNDTNPSLKVPFGFAGGLYDADTGLTRFGYRDYDAFTGKWTAKDPIGFAGGDSNLYGYVLGDPVNLVDPRGENPLAILLFLIGLSEYGNSPAVGEIPQSGPTEAAWVLPFGSFGKGTTEACMTVKSIDDILTNPKLLTGKTPSEVENALGNLPRGWGKEVLGKGSQKGNGFVLREYTPRGNPTGQQIRWHPGGGHHGTEPYWRVISNTHGKSGIIR